MFDYKFTQDWFSSEQKYWDVIIPKYKPSKILEIGSFEGRSTVYMIEKCSEYGPVELYCIDTWNGSDEFIAAGMDVSSIEQTFKHNIQNTKNYSKNNSCVYMLKSTSYESLAQLITTNKHFLYFDLIYIDGSHYASDVLTDACMSFPLLKENGILIFDDYRWGNFLENKSKYVLPKTGIDAFIDVFGDKIELIQFDDDPYQKYFIKNTKNAQKIN